MQYDSVIYINQREISLKSPAYFIADLASNHDGDLERAKELIYLAKESGADAVKFQHFKAEEIVSDWGFKNLGNQIGHQSGWKKSVFQVYKDYECNREWTEHLIKVARKAQIDFMTTPYDYEAVRLFANFIPAFKIGSGDITWLEFIEFIAQQDKPVMLATGAATMEDVDRAVQAAIKHNKKIVLMQCNTNYTGNLENFQHVNLNVLRSYSVYYPNMILGLSDHTPGHTTVLGAISLGARVVEKHFTDNNNRNGPDHSFSMNPGKWREMVERSRELEAALGNGVKRIEDNEKETVVVQRRSLYLTKDISNGQEITEKDLICLRPAPKGSIPPYKKEITLGKKVIKNKKAGEILLADDLEDYQC